MVAIGYGLQDKVSLSGSIMSGTLTFEGTPPFTVVRNTWAGTVTLNGTAAVTVATTAPQAGSLVFLSVAPGPAPQGTPYVASVTAGSGFTVKSTSSSDTSVVCAWFILTAV